MTQDFGEQLSLQLWKVFNMTFKFEFYTNDSCIKRCTDYRAMSETKKKKSNQLRQEIRVQVQQNTTDSKINIWSYETETATGTERTKQTQVRVTVREKMSPTAFIFLLKHFLCMLFPLLFHFMLAPNTGELNASRDSCE